MYWYFVVRYLSATGTRVSELIQMKCEYVRIGHFNIYSKGRKSRRIYIPIALRKETIEWLEPNNRRSGFVFLNKSGNRLTAWGLARQLKHFTTRYGLDLNVVYPHFFRHRFAKSFLERYNDLAMLADLMGHESIETTRIYLRKTNIEQQNIVNKVVDL